MSGGASTLSGVRAVTFDCWGTLIVERAGDDARSLRIEAISTVCGVGASRAAGLLSEAWTVHFDEWVAGRQYGSPCMARWILDRTTGERDGALAELTRAFEEATLATGVRVVDGAASTLERLRAQGRPIGLVCDTGFTPGRVVRRLFVEHRLAPAIDAWAFSDEVGVPKPAREMFDAALGRLGNVPAVHVGDLRRTDVAGARAAGLASVRFTGVWDDASDHPDADLVIGALRDLPDLLLA